MLVDEVDKPIAQSVTVRPVAEKGSNDVWICSRSHSRGARNADIVKYLEEIDATLRPFGGRFAIHGGDVEVLEGEWPGHVVLIEFPDRDSARAWYRSPTYQLGVRAGAVRR